MADIQKKAYWVVGLLILGLSAYFYYTSMNRPVAGVLWFIGGFLILYYYWIKWFVLDQPLDADLYFGTNACPDYLSPLPNNTGLYAPTTKTQYFCVDFVGVSRNGGIKRTSPTNVVTDVNDPAYTFSVDPLVDFASPAGKAAFIQRLQTAGLSYNSVGDSSLPTLSAQSNGAPVFSGGNAPPSMGGGAPGGLMGAAASSAGPTMPGMF